MRGGRDGYGHPDCGLVVGPGNKSSGEGREIFGEVLNVPTCAVQEM